MELHFIQQAILKKLLFLPKAKHSDLRPNDDIENNKLTFHISQLISLGLIEKDTNGLYTLTNKGKENANRMDTDTLRTVRQGKVCTILCCTRLGSNNQREYLVYTRKKQPFFDSQGYPSGKARFGETIYEAAERELKEETNLTPSKSPDLFLIEHQIVYSPDKSSLLEDKFFFFVMFENPSGEIIANEEGIYEWVDENDLDTYVVKPFESMDKMKEVNELMKNYKNGFPMYREVAHLADNY